MIQDKPRSGRPRATTPEQDALAAHFLLPTDGEAELGRRKAITGGEKISATVLSSPQIAEMFGLPEVAAATWMRRALAAGLRYRHTKNRIKSFLRPGHKLNRYKFAEEYKDKSLSYWKTVAFTDEKWCYVARGGWFRPGQEQDDTEEDQGNETNYRINCWGSVSWDSRSELYIWDASEGQVTGAFYAERIMPLITGS